MKTVVVFCKKGGEGKTLYSHLLCWRARMLAPNITVLYSAEDTQEDGYLRSMERGVPPHKGVLSCNRWGWNSIWGLEDASSSKFLSDYKLLVFDMPPDITSLGILERKKIKPDIWVFPISSEDGWRNSYGSKKVFEMYGGKRFWLPTGEGSYLEKEMRGAFLYSMGDTVLPSIPYSEVLKKVRIKCLPPWEISSKAVENEDIKGVCDELLFEVGIGNGRQPKYVLPSLKGARGSRKVLSR